MTEENRARSGLTALLAAIAAGTLALLLLGVFSARGATSWDSRQIDEQLARAGPFRVLVLGNSCTISFDETALAEALDVPVAKVFVPWSTGPVWYAVLKNRVYANGYRPDLVIVPTTLSAALSTVPASEQATRRLLAQMSEDDPVLEAKALGLGPWRPWTWRAQRNLERLRESLLWSVPRRAIAVGAGRPGTPAPGETSERALVQVFALDAMMPERLQDAWVEGREPGQTLPPPADSLVPELIDLARAHGSEIVFVRIPPAPGAASFDPVSVAAERDLVGLLNDRGAGYLDARRLRLGPDDYLDFIHLDRSGRARLTAAFVRMLQQWGGLDELVVPRAPLPVAPLRAARSGEPGPPLTLGATPSGHDTCTHEIRDPLLAETSTAGLRLLGLESLPPPFELRVGDRVLVADDEPGRPCGEGVFQSHGDRVRFRPPRGTTGDEVEVAPAPPPGDPADAGWIHPGTSLELAFEGPAQEGALTVEVHLQPVTGPPWPHRLPELAVDGGAPVPFASRGGLLWGSAEVPHAAGAPWTVRVAVPRGCPLVALQGIRAGPERRLRSVFSLPGATARPAVAVLGPPLEELRIRFPSDPYPLPDHLAAPTVRAGAAPGVGVLDVPELALVAGPCSPVGVYEDGALLLSALGVPQRVAPCERVADLAGTTCHRGDRVFFSTLDGSDPLRNGRAYRLGVPRTALEPRPMCRGHLWVHPGDEIEIQVDPARLRALQEGANLLTLSGMAFASRPVTEELGVSVRVGAETVAEGSVSPPALSRDAAALELPRITPTAEGVSVVLRNPPAGAHLRLFKASLLEVERDPSPAADGSRHRGTAPAPP